MATEKGNYAIIGATGGIGSALARRLLDAGHGVMAGVRKVEAAERLEALEGAEIALIDALDWEAYGGFFDRMEETLGRIDGGLGTLYSKKR